MEKFFDVSIKIQNESQEIPNWSNITKTFKKKFNQTANIKKIKNLILVFAEHENNTKELHNLLLKKPELLTSALRLMSKEEINNARNHINSKNYAEKYIGFLFLTVPSIMPIGMFLFGLSLNTIIDFAYINNETDITPIDYTMNKFITSFSAGCCIPVYMLYLIGGLYFIKNKQKEPKRPLRKRIQKTIKFIIKQEKEYKNELERMHKQLKKYGFIKNKNGKIIYNNLEIVINQKVSDKSKLTKKFDQQNIEQKEKVGLTIM